MLNANANLIDVVDYIDGKLDYLINLTGDVHDEVRATRRRWRSIATEHPETGDLGATAAAVHSRFVLVRRDGRKMFTAQYWVRVLDGATCWIPAWTHERIQIMETDEWIPLEEVG